jgi:hypothetical protein
MVAYLNARSPWGLADRSLRPLVSRSILRMVRPVYQFRHAACKTAWPPRSRHLDKVPARPAQRAETQQRPQRKHLRKPLPPQPPQLAS